MNWKNKTIIQWRIGTFSLNNIVAIKDENKDIVERIKKSAKNLYEKCKENPYQTDLECKLGGYRDLNISEGISTFGPIKVTTQTDNYTLMFMGGEYEPKVEAFVTDLYEGTKSKIVDANGNEKNSIMSGEEFYVRVEGSEKIFSALKIKTKTNYLTAKIFEKKDNKHEYVVLDSSDIEYEDISSLISNVDYGSLVVNFYSDRTEFVEDVKFKLYDSQGKLYGDFDGFEKEYTIELPEGRYTLDVYDMPDGYFLDNTKIDVQVTNNTSTTLRTHMDSTEGL